MRGPRRGGWALAALLALGAVVQAGDAPADGKGKDAGWWGSWFGKKDKPEDKKTALQVQDRPVAAPSPTEQAAAIRERELNSYMRRLEVCDRLKELAIQAGNEDQVRQIEQLADRAWQIYQQRTGSLSSQSAVTNLDAQALERNLGPLRQPTPADFEPTRPAGARSANLGEGKR